MAVSFTDQVFVYLANPDNHAAFGGTIGLAAFAKDSFARRYGANGFQVLNATIDALSDFSSQALFVEETRIKGYREKRSEKPERNWYELKISRSDVVWVDASFTLPVTLSVQAFPGSVQLGPQGGVAFAGVTDAPPLGHILKFQLPVTTDQTSLAVVAKLFVFVTNDPAPAADLRRIVSARLRLEQDPQFLASLDGTAEQTPYLFVQLYPSGLLVGPPLSEASVKTAFANVDILAGFISIPAA